MSAGALFGTLFNFVAFAVLWAIVGFVFEQVAKAFNMVIKVLPTFQDAVNGFTTIQTIYGVALPVIVFIMLVLNYIIVENANSNQDV